MSVLIIVETQEYKKLLRLEKQLVKTDLLITDEMSYLTSTGISLNCFSSLYPTERNHLDKPEILRLDFYA